MGKTFRANDDDAMDWNEGEAEIRRSIRRARKAAKRNRGDRREDRFAELEIQDDV